MVHRVPVVDPVLPLDLLEYPHPEEVGLYLPRDRYERRRVHVRCREGRREVRRPWPHRRGHRRGDLPVGPEVPVRHVAAPLLVLDLDDVYVGRQVPGRVEYRDVPVPRDTKDVLHSRLPERLYNVLGSCSLRGLHNGDGAERGILIVSAEDPPNIKGIIFP